MLRVFYPALAQFREIFPRIEELEGRSVASRLPFRSRAPWAWDVKAPAFTTRPRAAMTMRRLTADSAGRNTRNTARWRS